MTALEPELDERPTSTPPRSRRKAKPRTALEPQGHGGALKRRHATLEPAARWRSRITGQGTAIPAELVANPKNWRHHPKFQADAMAGVLDEIGWVQQVVVNRTTGNLVDGHLRVELAVARGETSIPVLYVELTEGEEALVLATLDPLSAIAKTDATALRELLATVEPESRDVRALLADLAREVGMDDPIEGAIGEDELPADHGEIYVERGELWLLGEHRLMIGDSREPADVDRLLDTAEIDMVWTDPPYGVDYTGKTNERLKIEHDEMAGLEELLTTTLTAAVEALRPGGAIYVCAPGGPASFTFADVLRRLEVYRQTICWVKDVFVMGRQDYQWRHELVQLGVKPDKATKAAGRVIYGWRPGAAHYFIPERDLDTVWEIPRPKASLDHPTMKPVELVRRCISYSSRRGDSVFDPFLGSGTTIIAAAEIGRRAYGMEIDPMYAQRAIERWQAWSGQEARRG